MNPNLKPTVIGSTNYGGGLNRIQVGLQRNEYLELAAKAMDELLKLGQIDAPLWTPKVEGGGETLNLYEYTRAFSPLAGTKPLGFVSEATRARGVVSLSSVSLVESLLDAVSLLFVSLVNIPLINYNISENRIDGEKCSWA